MSARVPVAACIPLIIKINMADWPHAAFFALLKETTAATDFVTPLTSCPLVLCVVLGHALPETRASGRKYKSQWEEKQRVQESSDGVP